jgi:NTP pyrophosphatase (non-canonical NTP hydrolase)
MTISKELADEIIQFNKDRDWDKFHNPKDLSISICLEASELLENFQWTGADLDGKDPENMKEELADIMIYCILMAQAMNVDPEEIIRKKLELDAVKYPVAKSRGNANKYTEFK